MKSLVYILLISLSGHLQAQTQTFEKTLNVQNRSIRIDAELVDLINVSSEMSDELSVKITYAINGGELNDLVKIDLEELEGRISLAVNIDKEELGEDDFYDCDKDQLLEWGYSNNRKSVCIDIKIDLQIPAKSNIKIESVLADILLKGEFLEVAAKTVTGEIEMEWPENEGAEVELKTVNGSIYTNHNFQLPSVNGLPLISSHEIKTKLGGGYKSVKLETVTSNIYFRKF